MENNILPEANFKSLEEQKSQSTHNTNANEAANVARRRNYSVGRTEGLWKRSSNVFWYFDFGDPGPVISGRSPLALRVSDFLSTSYNLAVTFFDASRLACGYANASIKDVEFVILKLLPREKTPKIVLERLLPLEKF